MSKKSKGKKSSFSQRHGSQHPSVKKVTPQQLGHDQQLPVNPPTPGGSPLINPGEAGHPMDSAVGESMQSPSGEEFN
jgi:hypothetical protein